MIVMKVRKSAVVLIVAVLLLAAAFIYFDTNLLDHLKQTSQKDAITETDIKEADKDLPDDENKDAAPDEPLDETKDDPSAAGEGVSEDTLIAYEDVPVSYDTPEYNLSVKLCESPDKKTFIRLQYYSSGASTVNELDEEQIPELAGIFESRGETGQDKDANSGSQGDQYRPYSIGQALLNPAHGQLYLLINGASVNKYIQASLYVADLNDLSVKKLFSYPARYGRMVFSRDFNMLAYSFSDPPNMSVYKENELVEVFDCVNGEFIIKGSRKADKSIIGSNSDPNMLYDYTFDNWHSLNVIRLSQSARPKDDPKAEPIKTTVYYDIKEDLLLDADGKALSPDSGDDGKDSTDDSGGSNADAGSGTEDVYATAESESIKRLMEFYTCLAQESQYSKAMLMLDDGFILRLSMLKQFGITEIYKRDIEYSESNVQLYTELLKTATFDELASVSTVDEKTVLINYYQTLGITPESKAKLLLTATLVKNDEGWVITLIEDGI